MTNAEKFLRDGAGGVQDFTEALMKFNEEGKFVTEWYAKGHSKDFIDLFLNEPAKPTLTEDERVILRNIDKKYSIIYRDNLGRLEVKSVEIERTIWKISMVGYNHLFQFIKNGEEYEIAELLGDEK